MGMKFLRLTNLIPCLVLGSLLLFTAATASTGEELSLSVDPLHVGGWTMAVLEGAGPQQNVIFLYSRDGNDSFQYSELLTLSLTPPITKVAFAQTNWAGTAMALIPVGPSIATIGTQIWGQAIVLDDDGLWKTSPVTTEIIQP